MADQDGNGKVWEMISFGTREFGGRSQISVKGHATYVLVCTISTMPITTSFKNIKPEIKKERSLWLE